MGNKKIIYKYQVNDIKRKVSNVNNKIFWVYIISFLHLYFLYNLILSTTNNPIYKYSELYLLGGITLSIILLTISLIDIYYMYIPRYISRIGIYIGLIFVLIISLIEGWPNGIEMLIDHILAAIFGGLAIKSLKSISEKVLGQEALGLGDAKLVALGGIWLGSIDLTLAIGLAFVSAGTFSFLALICRKLSPLDPFPFAPFISAGILGVWLFEPNWWATRWLSLWGF